MNRRRAVAAVWPTAGLLVLAGGGPVDAHSLGGLHESPLPLAVYLAGAGLAVAISFAIAFAFAGTWHARPTEQIRRVPRAVILGLRLLGLAAWAWIVVQLVVGGSSSAEVDSLFTWVYGWVGLALVCAFLGPVWSWLDPFTTLHDAGAWVVRRVGLAGRSPSPLPGWVATWPAVAGFIFFVWLELAYLYTDMGPIVVGYTVVTLVGMTLFGRDRWRRHGEVFSVWFGLLGRLARYAPAGPVGSPAVRRQPFPDGLLGSRWDASLVVLVAVSVAAILFDGLSQTEVYFRLFGLPDLAERSVILGLFLALVSGAALLLARRVGPRAVGAGLLPISVGYLIAHYLTFLLGEGQRIVIAASDPLQLGSDLLGTAFWTPSLDWLPSELLWTVMFLAVVGGHVLGAWAGHLGAVGSARLGQDVQRAQLPLVALMVLLTALTLWSLGQGVFSPTATAAADVTGT